MARRPRSTRDAQDRMADELHHILKRQVEEAKPYVPTVSVEEAKHGDRQIEFKSERDITRVLFISTDETLLNPEQQSLDGYLNAADVFDEVHILILREGIEPKHPVIRPAENVYLYTVANERWWLLPVAGYEMVAAQLVFADGLRPDLIVARDPFESAIVAWWVGKKFNKPMQLHVLKPYFHPLFAGEITGLWLKKLIARFLFRSFKSARVNTTITYDWMVSHTNIADIQKLPQLNPYGALAQSIPAADLRERFPQYVFTVAYIGSLEDPAAALDAIAAARFMLKNKRISMIIVGTGRGKAECEKYVQFLELEEQVLFDTNTIQIMPYIKATDLLIVTNTDPESEELVLKAAAVGVPMVMVRTDARDDMFTHLESAYLCEPGDTQAYSDGVVELMKNYEQRTQIAEQAKKMVEMTFHKNAVTYRNEYRASIESALFLDEVTVTEDVDAGESEGDEQNNVEAHD